MQDKLFFISFIIAFTTLYIRAQQNQVPRNNIWNVADFDVKGDGRTLNTKVFQKIIDDCSQSGGGIVKVSSGTYLIGTIFLKNNVQLFIDSDAELKASSNRQDYVGIPQKGGLHDKYFLIFAENATHLSITGKGKINGNGNLFWEKEMLSDFVRKPKEWRPSGLIGFVNCRFLSITDLFLTNSPCYTIWTLGCDNVRINSITIRNAIDGPNTDGIDIDCCRGVLVSNCNIEGGDDAIAIKSDGGRLGENRPCENVIVSDCILSSPPACGVRIGYEGDSPIRNCIFSNLAISDSNHGINLISVLPNPGYPNLILEGTKIENIQFNNIVMHNVMQPIYLWMGNEKPEKPFMGYMRKINISNLIATNVGNSFIGSSLSDRKIEDITLSNVKISPTKNLSEAAYVNVWGSRHPYLFYVKNVSRLQANQLNVDFSSTTTNWQNALYIEDATDVNLNSFSIIKTASTPSNSLISVKNSNIKISNCGKASDENFLTQDDESIVAFDYQNFK